MCNYENAIDLLTSQDKFVIKPELQRILSVLKLLENPQDKLTCIHVAGTNGKGSVCRILHSILVESGLNVGLFTSPHIFDYTERISINYENISKDDFAKYIFSINKLAKLNGINLTEFEIITAVMFKYFYDKKVDIVILETGLGGKYDATNVIKSNLCSVITHIDLEHTDILGNTLDKILVQKAGIIKPNCPCIVYNDLKNINSKDFYDIVEKNSSELVFAPTNSEYVEFGLKGDFQQENLSIGLSVIKKCFPKIPEKIIQKAIKNVKNPFRYEFFANKNILIDCAHNPAGINRLVESLNKDFPKTPRRFIFGALKTKNYEKMIKILSEQIVDGILPEFYFYKSKHPKSCDTKDLIQKCPYKAKSFSKNSDIIDFSDGRLTIVCGSMYMISEIYSLLNLKTSVNFKMLINFNNILQ